MIAIFSRDGTLLAVLSVFYDDVMREKHSTGYTTHEFSCPANEHLVVENMIAVPDPEGNFIPFIIKQVETSLGNEMTVQSEIASMELIGKNLRPHGPVTMTVNNVLATILEDTRWRPGVIETTKEVTFSVSTYMTAIEYLNQLRQDLEMEIRYRVTWQGNRITGRYVDLLQRRGQDRGLVFEYKHNIKGMTRTEDSNDLATALIGVGAEDPETEKPITFTDVEWGESKPTIKPRGQDYVSDPEAVARWGFIEHIYDGATDEEDPEKLLYRTWQALQLRKNPKMTYDVDPALLERAAGYGDEKVRIGDTVRVKNADFDPPLLLWARVIELESSQTGPGNAILGEYRLAFTKEISGLRETQDRLRRKEQTWNKVGEIITKDEGGMVQVDTAKLSDKFVGLEHALQIAEGAVADTQIADGAITNEKIAPGIDTSKLSDKFVGLDHALQIANTAVTGDKLAVGSVTAHAIAADAIGAAAIAAGAIVSDHISADGIIANKIKGGTLTLGGENDVNGVLSIKNADGTEVVKGNEDGLKVDGGSYLITDKGMDTSLVQLPNLVPDHSFECLERTGTEHATYHDFEIAPTSGNWFEWNKQGSPKLHSVRNSSFYPEAIFGLQCVVVNRTNYLYLYVNCKPNTQYYLSGFTCRSLRNPSTGIPKLDYDCLDINGNSIPGGQSQTFVPNTGVFNWKRVGYSLTTPTNCALIRMTVLADDSNYVCWDAIQLVEGNKPVKYEPEENLWRHMHQVSGLPLQGHIIESGSNANGNYVKFSDGTLICWYYGSKNVAINKAYGSLYQGTITCTFPAAFYSKPAVSIGQAKWGTGASWGAVSSTNTTSTVLRFLDAFSRSSASMDISYIAIGRWK